MQTGAKQYQLCIMCLDGINDETDDDASTLKPGDVVVVTSTDDCTICQEMCLVNYGGQYHARL